MRTGVNPEKLKKDKILYLKHRVIIPVYIPNLQEDFYKNAYEVFKCHMESLLNTIDLKTTGITIINNNCTLEISSYIEELLKQNKIQKLVKYSENMGKVYTVLSEIKASFEEFITITDADVFFMNDWENAIFNIFNKFPKAGFVSPLPCPANYKYLNRPLLVREFFNLKLINLIKPYDFELFENGVRPKKGYFSGKKWNWKDKQYIIENDDNVACVGATHFVFTFKKVYLSGIELKGPEFVFKNGDEKIYLEKYFEEKGGYRLSTINSYAYHMGNTIDLWIKEYHHSKKQQKITEKFTPTLKITKSVLYIYKVLFFVLSKIKYKN